jgi:hypothetical protein
VRAIRLDDPSRARRAVEPAAVAGALLRLLDWRLLSPPWPGFPEPFAGQWARRRAIELLAWRMRPDAIVETGTFLGLTTRALSRLGAPVYSVEVKPAYHHLAKLAVRGCDGVTLLCGDSVAALEWLRAQGAVRRPLAYLDAHWWEPLPLPREVACLLGGWDDALVVVDDCRVPDDPGYGYDAYGGVPIAADALPLDGALTAYPAVPATREGGARRGTLYLARGPESEAALALGVERGVLRPAP